MVLSNPAVKSFVDQPTSSVSATSLSSLVTALKNPAAASELTGDAANAAVLGELLQRLLEVSNDSTRKTEVRVMSLEGFFWLSQVASEAVRVGTIFKYVLQLNASFDEMLERETDGLSAQRELLTVLLLRCTGYVRMKAGDVLSQLCRGDDRILMDMLLSMLANDTYEWAVSQAVLRWLYELTTPACHFQEPTRETTDVRAFQTKIALLLEHSLQRRVLVQVLGQLCTRWQKAVAVTLASATTTILTTNQYNEILRWAVAMRHMSSIVENLSEYCDRPDDVRSLQRSMLAESEAFFSTLLVPFVLMATHAWESEGHAVAPTAGTDPTSDPVISAVLSALQLLRYALFRPAVAPSPALVVQLQLLAQYTTRMVPKLRANYAGLMVILYVVQALANANAFTIRSPVDLYSAYELLMSTIATDKETLVPGGPVTAAQAFMICCIREESPYVETDNESVRLIHTMLKTEEHLMQEDAEALEAVVALEGQLEYLQAIIMQVALTQLLAELSQESAAVDTAATDGGAQQRAVTNPLPPPPKDIPKKKKHPPKYVCMLTKKLMREPVVLPNGHHFERSALQHIIDQVGHVDPISGEVLNGEVEVDEALCQEIAAYRVARAAETR